MAPGSGGKEGDGRPGSGGITRGRADAALEHTGETEGDTKGMAPQRLPPGAKAPQPSFRLSVGRGEPTANPIRDGNPGGAGAEGPGVATWHRRLAPHVRDVVRGFFRSAPPTAPASAGAVPPLRGASAGAVPPLPPDSSPPLPPAPAGGSGAAPGGTGR